MTGGKCDLQKMIVCKTILLAWIANDRERERSVFLPCVNARRRSGGLVKTWSSWFKVQYHDFCVHFEWYPELDKTSWAVFLLQSEKQSRGDMTQRLQ